MIKSVLVAFGANLGNPIQTLTEAFQELSKEWTAVAASSLYRSTPVGGVEQDDFINAVALFGCERTGLEILGRLHEVENAHERTREVRWGPRTLDLDMIMLWCEGIPEISQDPVLTLPHPRAWERVFVTAPWKELRLEGSLSQLPGFGEVAGLASSHEEITRLESRLDS